MCIEVHAGEPLELMVDASSLEGSNPRKLAVMVTDPSGEKMLADVERDTAPDPHSQLYRCSYTPVTEGLYMN